MQTDCEVVHNVQNFLTPGPTQAIEIAVVEFELAQARSAFTITTFPYRIDRWDADGNSVLEHLADIDDLERIPVMFEHSQHGERSSCILAG